MTKSSLSSSDEKSMKPKDLVLAVFLFLVLSLLSVPHTAASQRAAVDDCVSCHEEQVMSFKDSIHGKKGFEMLAGRACETCHGPGMEHVNSDGDPEKIRSFDRMNPGEKSETCLFCHDKGDRMYWIGSSHNLRGLACQECHSIHSPKSKEALLSAEDGYSVCFRCHKQKASQFYRASHHPIREGKMTCADCHNPHGTESPRLISSQPINEKCYECHAEKRGPFLWEHQPVREDCTICHDPHGTNHFKMVKTRLPYLCQRCHADGGHPSGLYDQSQIESRRFFNRSCTNCHTAIHGTNHPSGHTFLR